MPRTSHAAARRTAIILTDALTSQLARRRIRGAQIELRVRRNHLEIAVGITPDSEAIALVPTNPGRNTIRIALDTSSPSMHRTARDVAGPAAAATALVDTIAYVLTATYQGQPREHTN